MSSTIAPWSVNKPFDADACQEALWKIPDVKTIVKIRSAGWGAGEKRYEEKDSRDHDEAVTKRAQTTKLINELFQYVKQAATEGKHELRFNSLDKEQTTPKCMREEHDPEIIQRCQKIFNEALSIRFQVPFSAMWQLQWDPANEYLYMGRPKLGVKITTQRSFLESLLSDDQYTDVVFKVQGELFHCHRVIMARSPVLEQMWKGNTRERREEGNLRPIELSEEIDKEEFTAFRYYLYMGKLPKDYSCEMSKIVSMLRFAHFMDVEPLLMLCTAYVDKALSIDAVRNESIAENWILDLAILVSFLELEKLQELLVWYFNHNSDFAERFDISEFSAPELISLHDVAKRSSCDSFIQATLFYMEIQFSNESCNWDEVLSALAGFKDSEIKDLVQTTLKNPEIKKRVQADELLNEIFTDLSY